MRKRFLLKQLESIFKKIYYASVVFFIGGLYFVYDKYKNQDYYNLDFFLTIYVKLLGIPFIIVLIIMFTYLFIKRYNKKNGIY
jgi:hypothetical protein